MKNKKWVMLRTGVRVTSSEYAIVNAPVVERVALYVAMFAAVWGITVLVAVVVPAIWGGAR